MPWGGRGHRAASCFNTVQMQRLKPGWCTAIGGGRGGKVGHVDIVSHFLIGASLWLHKTSIHPLLPLGTNVAATFHVCSTRASAFVWEIMARWLLNLTNKSLGKENDSLQHNSTYSLIRVCLWWMIWFLLWDTWCSGAIERRGYRARAGKLARKYVSRRLLMSEWLFSLRSPCECNCKTNLWNRKKKSFKIKGSSKAFSK